MSAKAYAEKNAGRRVRVYVSKAGPNARLVKWPICRVVGYYTDGEDGDDEYVYVEFEDPALQQSCSNPNNTPGFVRTALSTKAGVWMIKYDQLRFLRGPKKEAKPISPYPHTCKKCKSPARNCANYVLCSNTRCGANKAFKKMVFAKVPKISRIKCPTCKANAIEVGAMRNTDNVPTWRFNCAKKHTWTYVPKENDIVSSARQNERDRIWKTNGWQLH